ncbi:MAG: hypothetical protein HY023_05965 [Chloroflexi bacterium]|nr:hypothetical protein [Chloroflexota bacterium]
MARMRLQALIALVGMILVGWLLLLQSGGFVYSTVAAQGGVYTEALIGQPGRFNPLLETGNQVDRDVDRLIFSGLTTWDTAGKPVPDLAASWFISPDGLTYTFNLRGDVRWHDGQRFSADDVLFTISLLRDPAYPGPADLGALWRSVTVTRISDLSISFTLPEPFAPFLDYTAVGILPAHILPGVSAADLKTTPFNQTPIGTGPYRFVSLGTNPTATPSASVAVSEVLLEGNPYYYGHPHLLNQIRFRFYPDTHTAFQAYLDGQVQGISEIGPKELPAALTNPNLNLFSTRLPKFSLIYLNLEKDRVPLFQEKKIRQALLFGLNRQWMVDHLLAGQAFVATSPIVPGTWAYNSNLIPVDFDPLHAASVLNEAGWALPAAAAPGTENYVRKKAKEAGAFTLLTPDDSQHVAIAQTAAEDWAKVGIKVTVEAQPAATVIDHLVKHDYEAALIDINFSRSPDPDPYPFWHQTQIENGQNYGNFNHRDISQLLETARVTTDFDARAKLYRSFQAKFADQTPALLLFYPIYTYGVDQRVKNVQIGPMVDPSDRFRGLAEWYVVTRRVIVTPGAESTAGPAPASP